MTTAGRKTLVPAAPAIRDEEIDEQKLDGAMQAMRAEGLALQQRDASVRAVALQLGYQLPADATDPDLIQRDIAANMRRSVEACLEVGRGLRVLKEACEHGSFMARLEVLGIEASVARRFMETATKFAKRATSHVLAAAGSQSKLFELLILDDEQIEELELTGQTGELKLDDVATMSVKELRAALREQRAETDATRRVLADKNAAMDKLRAQIKRIETAPRDMVQLELQKEATAIMQDALGAIRGGVRQALIKLRAHGDGSTRDDVFCAGLVGQLAHELQLLREEFRLPDVSNAAELELAAEVEQWAD
ncbi:hypothetical protein [Extensimonas vulgaris]|uniref:Uncharacterized protein n=1 Tax=Extensimonas vulgaris TaxID=1031594 RepID=A0A369AR52_9BURK|nr:hypothetical protein [Extensimonas vulgaris]RCX10716.1 hypothetical protein DFR45_102117 [Extensimonas vulgaris]TWI41358.1 hypothetical protein IP95_00115 [Extensimonas vulgaris]TXD16825.1 hypothetical protein FUT63_02205 [Extensimonas vulgaris]